MEKSPNILIVENELIIAADLKRQLKKLDYEVGAIATSVNEARACLQKMSFDLALLDIKLDGPEEGTVLGKELRLEGKIPFIYITSHYDRGTVAEAKATRPNGYLIKPFSQEDIYVSIEMALNNFAHKAIDEEISSTQNGTVNNAPFRIKKVVQYIHDHLDQKLTLPELAKQAGWNMYHFARLFKKHMKETPYQYLIKARIEKAKVLLKESEDNLAQVALGLGFENHSHFSQTFRKQVGVSPDAFRKSK